MLSFLIRYMMWMKAIKEESLRHQIIANEQAYGVKYDNKLDHKGNKANLKTLYHASGIAFMLAIVVDVTLVMVIVDLVITTFPQ